MVYSHLNVQQFDQRLSGGTTKSAPRSDSNVMVNSTISGCLIFYCMRHIWPQWVLRRDISAVIYFAEALFRMNYRYWSEIPRKLLLRNKCTSVGFSGLCMLWQWRRCTFAKGSLTFRKQYDSVSVNRSIKLVIKFYCLRSCTPKWQEQFTYSTAKHAAA